MLSSWPHSKASDLSTSALVYRGLDAIKKFFFRIVPMAGIAGLYAAPSLDPSLEKLLKETSELSHAKPKPSQCPGCEFYSSIDPILTSVVVTGRASEPMNPYLNLALRLPKHHYDPSETSFFLSSCLRGKDSADGKVKGQRPVYAIYSKRHGLFGEVDYFGFQSGFLRLCNDELRALAGLQVALGNFARVEGNYYFILQGQNGVNELQKITRTLLDALVGNGPVVKNLLGKYTAKDLLVALTPFTIFKRLNLSSPVFEDAFRSITVYARLEWRNDAGAGTPNAESPLQPFMGSFTLFKCLLIRFLKMPPSLVPGAPGNQKEGAWLCSFDLDLTPTLHSLLLYGLKKSHLSSRNSKQDHGRFPLFWSSKALENQGLWPRNLILIPYLTETTN